MAKRKPAKPRRPRTKRTFPRTTTTNVTTNWEALLVADEDAIQAFSIALCDLLHAVLSMHQKGRKK